MFVEEADVETDIEIFEDDDTDCVELTLLDEVKLAFLDDDNDEEGELLAE